MLYASRDTLLGDEVFMLTEKLFLGKAQDRDSSGEGGLDWRRTVFVWDRDWDVGDKGGWVHETF